MKPKEKPLTPEQIKQLQADREAKKLTGQIITKNVRDTKPKG
jgi:hypothetical protein